MRVVGGWNDLGSARSCTAPSSGSNPFFRTNPKKAAIEIHRADDWIFFYFGMKTFVFGTLVH